METKTVAHTVDHASHGKFRGGVAILHGAHRAASLLRGFFHPLYEGNATRGIPELSSNPGQGVLEAARRLRVGPTVGGWI